MELRVALRINSTRLGLGERCGPVSPTAGQRLPSSGERPAKAASELSPRRMRATSNGTGGWVGSAPGFATLTRRIALRPTTDNRLSGDAPTCESTNGRLT